MNIEIHLETEYEILLRENLRAKGHKIRPKDQLSDLIRKCINLHARKLAVNCWKIELSAELKSRTLPTETKAGLERVINEAVAGHNLNSRLSRTTNDLNYNDLLFNDWGFHHLHLGEKLDGSGFCKRTDDLLFLIARHGTLYFIDIIPHKGSFSSTSLLRIMHNNWPNIIAQYRLIGILGVDKQFNDSEIAELRKNGIQVLIDVGGAVYAPPGGGISTAGTSIQQTLQTDSLLQVLRNVEADIKNRETELRQHIKPPLPTNDKLHLKLIEISDDKIALRHLDSGTVFQFNLS